LRGTARCSAKLADQPLMRAVLADMALEVEGATAVVAARALLRRGGDRSPRPRSRALLTPVVKYWVCKTAPALLYEAMECLGGNGYVEEAPLARYYREAPVNAIWEGSGNVMALDVLRVLRHGRRAARRHAGGAVRRGFGAHPDRAACARGGGGRAEALGAGRIADAFIETRLAGQWRTTYGMLSARHDARIVIDTLYPEYYVMRLPGCPFSLNIRKLRDGPSTENCPHTTKNLIVAAPFLVLFRFHYCEEGGLN
jgi:putative acyl-CoA dehydrogenase